MTAGLTSDEAGNGVTQMTNKIVDRIDVLVAALGDGVVTTHEVFCELLGMNGETDQEVCAIEVALGLVLDMQQVILKANEVVVSDGEGETCIVGLDVDADGTIWF